VPTPVDEYREPNLTLVDIYFTQVTTIPIDSSTKGNPQHTRKSAGPAESRFDSAGALLLVDARNATRGICTDGTVAPCFPMYSSSFNRGNIENYRYDREQLTEMKKTCQNALFFDAQLQSRVLLPRCPGDQVDVAKCEARFVRRQRSFED
jgi:hypothetical protein